MRLSLKGKTYGFCRSCQTCEFYGVYHSGLWCEFPFGEIHWFGNKRIRPIKQNEIFEL